MPRPSTPRQEVAHRSRPRTLEPAHRGPARECRRRPQRRLRGTALPSRTCPPRLLLDVAVERLGHRHPLRPLVLKHLGDAELFVLGVADLSPLRPAATRDPGVEQRTSRSAPCAATRNEGLSAKPRRRERSNQRNSSFFSHSTPSKDALPRAGKEPYCSETKRVKIKLVCSRPFRHGRSDTRRSGREHLQGCTPVDARRVAGHHAAIEGGRLADLVGWQARQPNAKPAK